MTRHLLAISCVLLAVACRQPSTCTPVRLEGKTAIAAILAFDTIIPNTTIVVPDSIVYSSTKQITGLLDTLADRQLLSYRLLDSARNRRRLTGPQLDGPDTIMLYRYAISWSPAARPEGARRSVTSASFLGTILPGEVRYSGREVRIGKVAIIEDDTLYFDHSCEKIAFRYAYKMEPANDLGAALAGPAHMSTVRYCTDGQLTAETQRPAVEVAGP